MNENLTWETAPEIINAKEAAALTGWSAHKVYRWIKQKKLAAIKIGREWKIETAHLEQYRPDNLLARLQEKAATIE